MQRAVELLEKELENEIQPILKGMGFVLVEIIITFTKRSSSVEIVIYKPDGVTVADCSAVAKIIKPRLELRDELNDFQLQVASPGISRKLKSRREYDVFTGRGVSLLLDGNSEWTNGIIKEATDDFVVLQIGENTETIPFARIKRAKLISIEGEK